MALFRHTVKGVFPGEQWTFGIHTLGSVSVAAAQSAWVNAVAAFWSTEVAATMCTDVEIQAVSTAELNQATGKQLTRLETPVSHPGTNATACLPFQCAPVVSLRTALATRAGRGRFYAPSLAVDQQAGGKMIATAQTALRDGAVAMFGVLTGAGLDGVLYSRTTFQTQTLTSVDVGDVIDTQRRRRNKLIENRISANI